MNTILEKYDIIFLQDISPNNTTTLQFLTTRLPITVIQSHSNDKMAIAINHKMENLIKIIETNTLNLTEQVSQYVNDVIIQIQNTRIILVSVYYPIADKAPMQVTLTQQLNNELPKTYPIIMGGDFNHILNLATDRQTYGCDKQGEDKSRLESLDLYNNHKLVDVFREFYPNKIWATNKNPQNNRRIDRFHVSSQLMVQIPRFRQIKIPKLKSTHDAITFSYNLDKTQLIDILVQEGLSLNIMYSPTKTSLKKLKGSGSKIGVNYGNSFTKIYSLSLVDEKGEVADTTEAMLNVASNYMSGLYKKDTKVRHYIKNYLAKFPKRLGDDDRLLLAKPITLEELTCELDEASGDKTPGEDGISMKCLKNLWGVCGPALVKEANKIRKTGNLPKDFQRIIITLIPKHV
ncbi:Endonuclease-reverse transcriptase family protein [Candida albicans]|uniref:Endonuclease-reverse transcriptase family protein n=2 Tax=Candida albicans TaxID=5476 RepID=A0A8H6F3E4_CANAX|nr:Endonuclease-reverse transcriptase family protein [Candida albicans]KAF6069179.1 Endonuclease-reverse transcriptase family protein [Candida albicans]